MLPAPAGAAPEPVFDVWAILERHIFLVLFVLLISLLMGVLYFLKAPATYESSSRILIENKRKVAVSGEMNGEQPTFEKTIETHAMIIRSPMIVDLALKRVGLSNLPSLADVEKPVEFVERGITIDVAGDDTTILEVRYAGSRPDDCRKIVTALVDVYDEFLAKSNQDVDKQTTDLITQAKDELMQQLQTEESRYLEFQSKAPLIWKEGEGINPHQERQSEIEAVRRKLMVERSTLAAKIKSLESALTAGGTSREAVFYQALAMLRPAEQKELPVVDPQAMVQDYERETQRIYYAQLSRMYTEAIAEERRLSQDYADGHPDVVAARTRITELKRELDETQARIAAPPIGSGMQQANAQVIDYVGVYMQSLRTDYVTVSRQLESLDTHFQEEQKLATEMQVYLVQDQTYRSNIERIQMLFSAVVDRLNEIDIVRDSGGDRMSVLAEAGIGKQVNPNLVQSLGISGLVGLIAAFGLGYLVDRSEAMFRSPADIRRTLQVPVIGQIPLMNRKEMQVGELYPKLSPSLITIHHNGSNVSEAYRAVRTSLYFSTGGQDHRVIQVTSPLPGDGKSTLAANLAVTMARSGKRVLLLDADFRRPSVHKLFNISQHADSGLRAVLSGSVAPEEACVPSGLDHLSLLTVGGAVDNPSELLTSPFFKELIDVLRQKFDFVIVDTPPLLAVTDPAAVAPRVDGVLLTLRLRRGVQGAAARAREVLNNVEANVLGVVVNAVEAKGRYGRTGYRDGYGYGYGYSYGYRSEEYVASTVTSAAAKQLPLEASEVE
ncbi:MAG: polysaccharide biosynthesis tyrosine autokinase [Pirellulaceae bacterium]